MLWWTCVSRGSLITLPTYAYTVVSTNVRKWAKSVTRTIHVIEGAACQFMDINKSKTITGSTFHSVNTNDKRVGCAWIAGNNNVVYWKKLFKTFMFYKSLCLKMWNQCFWHCFSTKWTVALLHSLLLHNRKFFSEVWHQANDYIVEYYLLSR